MAHCGDFAARRRAAVARAKAALWISRAWREVLGFFLGGGGGGSRGLTFEGFGVVGFRAVGV